MKETDFIQQNKDKWKEFEDILQSPERDPQRLTDLFIQTTDDLSYSRTYYPNRSVRVYLNGIAQQVYQTLYKNKERERNFISKLWKRDLPEVLWHSRNSLLLSTLIFLIGLTIGVMSSIYYPGFAKIILGEGYIQMSEANINKGDPMAVYKNSEPILMFLEIAWNNIKIAFGTFVLGLLFGVGTVYIILYNSIMVGAFIYFFAAHDLLKESLLAIMLHGTLELSMIVLSGCAGFVLAKGVLFPGTYTRGQALMLSSRNGIKIMVAVTVLLVYAAVIESFLTRFTEVPDIIRALIILLSFGLVIGYFVWYPRYLHKKGEINDIPTEEKPIPNPIKIDLFSIKTTGRIFTESFSLLSQSIRRISYSAILIASILTTYFGIVTNSQFRYSNSYTDDFYSIIYPFIIFNSHLNFEQNPLLYPLIAVLFSLLGIFVYNLFAGKLGVSSIKFGLLEIMNGISIIMLGMLPLLLPHGIIAYVLILWFPICLIWFVVTIQNRISFLKTIKEVLFIISGNYWKMIGLFLSIVGVQWISYLTINSQITDVIGKFIQMNIAGDSNISANIPYFIKTFLIFFVPSIILTLHIYSSILFFYSSKEKNKALNLRNMIQQIGIKKKAYGMEKEA